MSTKNNVVVTNDSQVAKKNIQWEQSFRYKILAKFSVTNNWAKLLNGFSSLSLFLTVPSHCMHARIVHACASWRLHAQSLQTLIKMETCIERSIFSELLAIDSALWKTEKESETF